jgi:hypothetical protein
MMCLEGLGDHGQGEAKSRRGVTVGLRLEFVEAALFEPA